MILYFFFQYVFVSTKTNALHNACEHLLSDQTTLINMADAIEENLQFFVEYDRIHSVSKYLYPCIYGLEYN